MKTLSYFILHFLLVQICMGFDKSKMNTDPDATPQDPKDFQKSIYVQEPFQLDLIASEPLVNEPVCIAWGGDGALYVVELLTYMQDLDHTGAQEPVGQVVRLVDEDGDGRMDSRTVFVDKLVQPRAIMAVKGGILVGAPPNIFFCKDTTGNGIADVRNSIFEKFGKRSGNVEHKINGLMWGLDNWIYNAKSSDRFRYIYDEEGGRIEVGKTGFRGQWGITQDNLGNLYSTGNTIPWLGEQIAFEYLMHNRLSFDSKFSNLATIEEDFKYVWPIQGTPDAQGGMGAIRAEDNTLLRFTSIGGQHIFRGDKLGPKMEGQYFIPEPVGRLVRRGIFEEMENGLLKLYNPDKDKKLEFFSSTDPNFRPVNICTGPDGCLYVVDMYRGIIQDGNWTKPGSYLRNEIKRRNLDQNIQRGRIYRLSRKGISPDKIPRFDEYTNEQLIDALSHANGWRRDEAQKRLVLAQDRSVVPRLQEVALNESSVLGQLHAIWTLRGLESWDSSFAHQVLLSRDWRVKKEAIRASEDLFQKEVLFIKSFADTPMSHIQVSKQLILSLGLCNSIKGVPSKVKSAANDVILNLSMKEANQKLIVLSTIASMSGNEEKVLKKVLEGDLEISKAYEWVQLLTRVILNSKNTDRIEKLLSIAADSQPIHKKMFVQGLSDALPRNGRGDLQKVTLVRFQTKPDSLNQLQKFSNGNATTEEAMKNALIWFTWKGEPRFDKEYQVAPMLKWEQDLFNEGEAIYANLCSACHGKDGLGIVGGDGKSLLAPALDKNKRVEGDKDYVTKVLLHGMTGPIDGVTYGGLMASMGSNDDDWISGVLTYIRRAWSNGADTISKHDVRNVRKKNEDRKKPWTQEELQL